MNYKKEEVTNLLNTKCMNVFGCSIDDATEKQAYKSLCYVVKDLLDKAYNEILNKLTKKKRAEILSM